MLSDQETTRLLQVVQDRVACPDLWRAADGRVIDLNQARWISSQKKSLSVHLDDGTTVLIDRMLIGQMVKHLLSRRSSFRRTHNDALANLSRVRSVRRQDSQSYELHFGSDTLPAPVSGTYASATAEALGASNTLDHLTPASPYADAIEDLELINLGEEEAQQIAPGDVAAAAAWCEKWWIENLDSESMFRYFKLKTRDALDKTKIIRNAIWQRYLSVKWGIWEPDYGDVRDVYYHPIEDILARHDLLSESSHRNDPDTVSANLRDMVVKYRLFRYADFKFPDLYAPLRSVGDRYPHLIVFSEKPANHVKLRQFVVK